MRSILCFLVLGWGFGFFHIPDANALIAVSTLDFPADTFAVDSTSGDSEDYLYFHRASLDPEGFSLKSATLSLTHEGNQNDGPTREIWSLFSESGILIGTLGKSSSSPLQDMWALPDELVNEIRQQTEWQLNLVLTEQTPFNSEKLALIQSQWILEYDRRSSNPNSQAMVPEVASSLMFGLSLLFAKIGTRAREA